MHLVLALKAISLLLAANCLVLVASQHAIPQCSTTGSSNNDTQADSSFPCTTVDTDQVGYFVCRNSTRAMFPSGRQGRDLGRGRRRRRRRRGSRWLSRSRCVETVAAANPFRGERRPCRSQFVCGCCNGICPTLLDCSCTCDLRGRRRGVILPNAGVWVNVASTSAAGGMIRCVSPGYADADIATCVPPENCPTVIATGDTTISLPTIILDSVP